MIMMIDDDNDDYDGDDDDDDHHHHRVNSCEIGYIMPSTYMCYIHKQS